MTSPPSRCFLASFYYRTARARQTTSTRTAPTRRRAVAHAVTVDPVVYTSSTRQTRRGDGPRAENARATFPRRSARGRSRWRPMPGRRCSSAARGIDHAVERAAARAAADAWPRASPRSRSPGTNEMTSPTGRGRQATTRPAATAVRSRRPRSFHDVTKARAPSSYTSAARALAKAKRRPLHSTQRRTGHGPGAPQRSQHGGTHRTSRARQCPQTDSPTRPQTPHRRGSTTSRKCTPPTIDTDS
jgi:hypothetical protein